MQALSAQQRPLGQQRHQRPRLGRQRVQVLCAIKQKSGKEIVCSMTLIAKQDKTAQVMEMCKDIEAFSQQLLRDRKSGLVEYTCMKDRWEDNVFHMWERFDSHSSMGIYTGSDRVKLFMEQVQPLLDQPIGMALYQFEDGKLGATCLAEGPKGEGGLDDATGAGGAGGASMKQTSSTVNLTNIKEHEQEPVFNIGLNIKGLSGMKDLLGRVFKKKN